MEIDEEKYANIKETMESLKVSSCELMHMRVSGNLKFIKKGNAYFYGKDKEVG